MSQSNGRKTIFFGNRKYVNRLFKVIAWLTVFSLFAGYGIFSIKELFSGDTNSGIVNVNGLSIPVEEFKRNYMALNGFINMAKSEHGSSADMILRLWGIDSSKKAEDVVLEKLIQERVLQSLADSFGMNVSKDFVDTKLRDVSFMRNFVAGDVFQGGRLNSKLLEEYLNNQGMTLDDFEAQISESIKKKVLLEGIEGAGYIPESALKDEFIKKYSKRKYSIVSVGLGNYLRQVKESGVTDTDLSQYFKMHQESYRVPEKRYAKFWVFDPKNYGIIVEDEEISDFFEKNKNSYLKELQKDSKGEPVYKDLSDVRHEIQTKIAINKFTKQFGIDINRVFIELKQSPASFNSYITSKKADLLPDMQLTEDNTKQSQKIFGLSKLKDRTFFVENGKGYVGELIKIDKSYIPALKDIIEKVKQDWFKKKAQELAEETLTKLSDDKQKTIEEINSEVKGKLTKTDFLDPQNPETFKGLKDIGIKGDMLFNLEAVGQRASVVTDSTGLIIQLDDIDTLDQEQFEKKKNELKLSAKRTQSQNIFSDLLKNLEDKATIKINRKLLAQVLSKR